MGDKRRRLPCSIDSQLVPSNEAQLYNLSSYPPKKRFRSFLADVTNAPPPPPPPPSLLPAKKRVYAPWAEEMLHAQEKPEVPPACSFCQSSGDSECAGPLARYDAASGSLVEAAQAAAGAEHVYVHSRCSEWAPNVYFSAGDRVNNLDSELRRAQALRCAACGVKGAALGCFSQRCRRSYHFGCARRILGCAWDCTNFLLLCPQHAATSSRYRSRSLFLSQAEAEEEEEHDFS